MAATEPMLLDADAHQDKCMNILVVEDEVLIALDLVGTLEDLGHAVFGPAVETDEAIDVLTTERIELAFVDVKLGQRLSEQVVEICDSRGVIVIISSGHSTEALPTFAKERVLLSKPYSNGDLRKALKAATAGVDRDVQLL